MYTTFNNVDISTSNSTYISIIDKFSIVFVYYENIIYR